MHTCWKISSIRWVRYGLLTEKRTCLCSSVTSDHSQNGHKNVHLTPVMPQPCGYTQSVYGMRLWIQAVRSHFPSWNQLGHVRTICLEKWFMRTNRHNHASTYCKKKKKKRKHAVSPNAPIAAPPHLHKLAGICPKVHIKTLLIIGRDSLHAQMCIQL